MDSEARSPRLLRLRLGGSALQGFSIPEPAASIRLLVPRPGESFALPTWNGNEFLHDDGNRPALRTFTPVAVGPDGLVVDVVRHPGGAVSGWAESASPGDPCAVSGPGRGETIDPEAGRYLLFGDETAIPAIEQLLEAIPGPTPVDAHIEIVDHTARIPLPERADGRIEWHVAARDDPPGSAMRAAVNAAEIGEDTRLWVAGEAAAVQAIRRHLSDVRGVPRSRTTVRGYWKVRR